MRFIGLIWLASAAAIAVPPRVAVQFQRPIQSPVYRQHTFGLTSNQRLALFELTGGQVDLRYHYYRDAFTDSVLNILSPHLFKSFLNNNIPPPGILGVGSDPELQSQWWIERINAQKAWDLATGRGVTVADCDSGFYTDETDLAPNLVTQHRFDLADKDTPFDVSDGPWVTHGTSVAAILAAALDGKGTNGIAYNAKVVPLQNFNYDSSKDDLDKEEATARCILRAITLQDVKVIVLENQTATGSSETYAGTREAVKLALKAGITVVSAAGNFSQELKIEAENDTGSIIVGALTTSGAMANFSNRGPRVSIAAFGENLHTLSGPNGKMANFGGTSGATPQVAATVALMLEANPKLSPEQVKTALIATRVESPDTKDVGGLINTFAAVEKAKATQTDVLLIAEQIELRGRVRDVLQDSGNELLFGE